MQAKKHLNLYFMGLCMGLQNRLFSCSEPSLYHQPGQRGYFSVLTRKDGDRARQKSYPIDKLDWIIENLDPGIDSWVSQAEFFKPNRRLVNLLRLQLCFVDLDTHKAAIGNHPPQEQARALRFFCDSEGIPQPSLILFSGRGLHAKWLLDSPLPRQALIRWNAVQKVLVEKLDLFGADPMAKDASRVLRIENTINTKNGERVRVLDVDPGQNGPNRWCFEALCRELLPIDRQVLRAHHLKVVKSNQNLKGLHAFSGRQLAWDRLQDLRTLTTLRGGVAEGERTVNLHWRLNFLLLSGATNSQEMYYEAAELAREFCPDWNVVKSELSTLFAKAKAFERGEKVTFGNKQYSPLYTPKNSHLIDLFGITDEEESKLKTIIGKDEKGRRNKSRLENRRRVAGVVDRATYEAQSVSRLKPWEAFGMSRRSWYRNGKPVASSLSVEIETAIGTSPNVLQQKESQPWVILGMSRASWYRNGKPLPDVDFDLKNQELKGFETQVAQVRPYY